MIDPAWRFRTFSEKGCGKSPQAKYRTMTMDEIAALPVKDLAHKDGMLLWMWCTAPGIQQQIRILEDWGFKFVTSGAWVKTTKNGKVGFGTGYVLRGAHELFLIGKIGRIRTQSKSVRSAILARAREHSRKPDEAYEMARQLIPFGRAADVFSRETRPTWESFGDQAGMFDEASA
jgi:N6-adenosine-specific RNA methylase IME4